MNLQSLLSWKSSPPQVPHLVSVTQYNIGCLDTSLNLPPLMPSFVSPKWVIPRFPSYNFFSSFTLSLHELTLDFNHYLCVDNMQSLFLIQPKSQLLYQALILPLTTVSPQADIVLPKTDHSTFLVRADFSSESFLSFASIGWHRCSVFLKSLFLTYFRHLLPDEQCKTY